VVKEHLCALCGETLRPLRLKYEDFNLTAKFDEKKLHLHPKKLHFLPCLMRNSDVSRRPQESLNL